MILPRSELSTVLCTVRLDGVPSTVGTEYRAKNGQRKFCRLMWLSVCSNVVTRLMTIEKKHMYSMHLRMSVNQGGDEV